MSRMNIQLNIMKMLIVKCQNIINSLIQKVQCLWLLIISLCTIDINIFDFYDIKHFMLYLKHERLKNIEIL